MVPIDAGKDVETLRRRVLKVGDVLRKDVAIKPQTAAQAITVTLDSTFIRSCEDGERHLEVRAGNVETALGGRPQASPYFHLSRRAIIESAW
jgi:hypothetical protein